MKYIRLLLFCLVVAVSFAASALTLPMVYDLVLVWLLAIRQTISY